jgi:hypothetical protein
LFVFVAAIVAVVVLVSVRVLSLPAHMVFHVATAWEEEDGTVKVNLARCSVAQLCLGLVMHFLGVSSSCSLVLAYAMCSCCTAAVEV